MIEYLSLIIRPIVSHHQGLRGISIVNKRKIQEFILKINRDKENLMVINRVIQDTVSRIIKLSTLNYIDERTIDILKHIARVQIREVSETYFSGNIVEKEVIEESRIITGLLMLSDNLATAINMSLNCVEPRLITLEAARLAYITLCNGISNLPQEWCKRIEMIIKSWTRTL